MAAARKSVPRTSPTSEAQRELRAMRLAEQKREAAEWDGKSNAAEKLRDDWRRRWSLSLAIANSAALVGLGTVLLDEGKRPASWAILLLPAGWCFVVGVLAAGLIPLLKACQHENEKDWAWIVAREREEGGPTTIFMGHDEPEFSEEWRAIYRRKLIRFKKAVLIAEIVAGAGFVLGLLLPMAVMTLIAFDVAM